MLGRRRSLCDVGIVKHVLQECFRREVLFDLDGVHMAGLCHDDGLIANFGITYNHRSERVFILQRMDPVPASVIFRTMPRPSNSHSSALDPVRTSAPSLPFETESNDGFWELQFTSFFESVQVQEIKDGRRLSDTSLRQSDAIWHSTKRISREAQRYRHNELMIVADGRRHPEYVLSIS